LILCNTCNKTHLSAEAAEERIPAMAQGKCKVLVEEVSQKFTHAVVGPATMDQQQSLKVSELGNRIVTGQDSLKALLP